MDLQAQVNLQKDVTCPICLELLTEPLSLECDHSFCKACITAKNKESVIHAGGECSCPVCQSRYQPGTLQPNRHLATIVERVREINTNPRKRQKREFCEHHGEKLHMFCKDEEQAICRLCVVSREHQGHQIFCMEEVVKKIQEKLQEALKKLRKEQQKAAELEADIREERATWKNHMQTERQRILKGFNEMRCILDSLEQKELQKLEEDEVNVLENLVAAKDQLVQQSQYMRELISDLEHQMWGSSIDTLKDVINLIRRSETWTLKKPKMVSKKQKNAFRVPDLSGMLQVFKELTEVQCYWVDVMLNPVNAISNIVISADQRQVKILHPFTFRNVYPCDFSAFSVLGCQCFSSGKYYWEVEVSGKIAWILGVCSSKRCFNRKKSSGFTFDPNLNHSNVYSRYRPQYGYWVIALQNESEYKAFEDSSTSDPKVLTLSMAVPPRRVGVFLDYEGGTVSFFNVTNHGSLIYKFSKCHFSQTAYPYINPWNCPAPMTLCPPSS
ncbi:E3 ubiquitin-protein ligase TRIM22-like [Diceros bicornis minor]|uniref:E3 ubiquitin-protein ligase TRIM22-like n=1 Tax=Diceros bicornis minor TaxID=77932 RepID=UPI0026E9F039|nr:E3 ubiquitin-protein ligase TRIM22-like [Diceros bicornis minor]